MLHFDVAWISLWHCWAQVAFIAASSCLYCWVQCLTFLLTILFYGFRFRQVSWPIKLSNNRIRKSVTCGFGMVGIWQVLVEKEINISINLVRRWKHEVLKNLLKLAKHQQMKWHSKLSLTMKSSHWTSINLDSVTLHLRHEDNDFQMKCKIHFPLKRELWPTKQWSSFVQVRCF